MADRLDNLHITHLAEVSSTSDLARDAVEQGACEGTAFRADVQVAGRGRHGRDWISPKGNLYISVVLRPQRPLLEWPGLSLVASLALYDALATMRPRSRLGLKWPNDVLLDNRKVAGLLLESTGDAIILGCGVNCLHAPDNTTGWRPGWLNQNQDDDIITPDRLLESLAVFLCQRYNDWHNKGMDAIAPDWKQAAAHLGREITARQADGSTLSGTFENLSPDGSMMLRLPNGQLETMTAGDVVQTRPEGYSHAAGD